MSFILDALRKAEASRQGRVQRALTVPHPARGRRSSQQPPWLLTAAGVALAVLVIAAYLLYAGRPEPGPGPGATREESRVSAPVRPATAPRDRPDVRGLAGEARVAAADRAEPAAPRRTVVPGSVEVRDLLAEEQGGASAPSGVTPGRVEVRDLLGEAGLDQDDREALEAALAESVAPGGQDEQTVATDAQPLAEEIAPEPSTPPAVAPAETGRTAVAKPAPVPGSPAVPTMEELIVAGLITPPAMRLDVYVYGDDPASRFAYINMRRYRIGDETEQGAIVEDIVPEGAILSYRGRRFLLRPR